MSALKVSPARKAPFYRHGPGTNNCFTLNRTDVRIRAYGLTEKARLYLARQELLRVFGEEPMPSGVPYVLVDRGAKP